MGVIIIVICPFRHIYNDIWLQGRHRFGFLCLLTKSISSLWAIYSVYRYILSLIAHKILIAVTLLSNSIKLLWAHPEAPLIYFRGVKIEVLFAHAIYLIFFFYVYSFAVTTCPKISFQFASRSKLFLSELQSRIPLYFLVTESRFAKQTKNNSVGAVKKKKDQQYNNVIQERFFFKKDII